MSEIPEEEEWWLGCTLLSLSYPASAASPFTSHSPACCKCSEVVDSDGLFSLMVLVEGLAPGASYSAIAVMSFYLGYVCT